jgi:hypothetical protein
VRVKRIMSQKNPALAKIQVSRELYLTCMKNRRIRIILATAMARATAIFMTSPILK